MNIFNIYSFSLIILLLFPIVSCTLIFIVNKDNEHSKYLAAWVLCVLGISVPNILGFAGFFSQYNEYRYLPIAILCAPGPLLIFYFYSLTGSSLPTYLRALLAIPFAELLYRVILFLPSQQSKADWLTTWHQPVVDSFITGLGALLMLFAAVAVVINYLQYRSFLQERSSQAQDQPISLIWLSMAIILLLSFGWLYIELYELFGGLLSHKQEYPFYVGLLLLTFLLSQVSLVHSERGLPKFHPAVPSLVLDNGKPELETTTSDIKKIDSEQASQILTTIEESELYLRPRLNLEQTQSEIKVDEQQIRLAIKAAGYRNFNHFINAKRVEKAKHLLVESKLDVLNIAFEAGFNSKPSFNRAFKQIVGVSPTEYIANSSR